jgi:hypothetical protein
MIQKATSQARFQLLFKSGISKSQIDYKYKKKNKRSLKRRARAETNLGTNNFTCKNDVVVGYTHFRSSVSSKLTLPKLNDFQRQHIVNFSEESDSYFQLKVLPAIANCNENYY